MHINAQLIKFEIGLDDLILSELKEVTAEEVRKHFDTLTVYEYIKLVMWSTEE